MIMQADGGDRNAVGKYDANRRQAESGGNKGTYSLGKSDNTWPKYQSFMYYYPTFSYVVRSTGTLPHRTERCSVRAAHGVVACTSRRNRALIRANAKSLLGNYVCLCKESRA